MRGAARPALTSATERMSDERQRSTVDVAIMMGSKSDLETMRPAAKVLEALGLAVEVRVLSAHRTPERDGGLRQGRGPARRQGLHLRRGRRGPPRGRRGGAHDASRDRRAHRERPARRASTRCSRRCRCRPACPSRRSPWAAPRTPACSRRRSSRSATPSSRKKLEAEREGRRKKVLESDAEVSAQFGARRR